MASRSKIWCYFDKTAERAQCKFCSYNVLFKTKGSTSNLWNHLRNKHGSIFNNSSLDLLDTSIGKRNVDTQDNTASDSEYSDLSSQSSASKATAASCSSFGFLESPSSSATLAQQPKITDLFSTTRVNDQKQERITHLIAKMICVDTLPLSFIENKGFRELLANIAPAYRIPVKKTIQLRIDAMYEKEKNKLVNELSVNNDCALTTDCWSSRANESYIGVTAHYINSNWEHVARNVTTELMEERHTIPNLKDKIETILTEWQIMNKTTTIVHDLAANITGAVRELPYESIPCFAHALQLVLNKVLANENVASLTTKCSSIVGHFKHSNVASAALKIKQVQLRLEPHKLIQSVKTRWNSTYYMIQRMLEQREAIIGVLSDRTITTKTQAANLILTEQEWTTLEDIAKALEPFELVTTLLSSESQPTISLVLPILKSLQDNFLTKAEDEDSINLRKMRQLLLEELRSRFKNVLGTDTLTGSSEINTFDISTFLDPRFKNHERFVGCLLKTKRHINSILEQKQMGNENDISDSEVTVNPPPNKKLALDILFPKDAGCSPNEVENYFTEAAISKNLCPLQWWKCHQNQYPQLAKLAKRYLCIPATSTPSERAFSNAGNIVTAKRSCLKPDTVQKICFLSSNMQ